MVVYIVEAYIIASQAMITTCESMGSRQRWTERFGDTIAMIEWLVFIESHLQLHILYTRRDAVATSYTFF